MYKKLFVLLAFLLPTLAWADQNSSAAFAINYDLDATAITYCNVTGVNGSPYGSPIPGLTRIKTTGSSATTVEFASSEAPFTPISVGDTLFVDNRDGTTLVRTVIARASASSITVNAAWDLSATGGYSFRWLKTNCGTSASSGWIDTSNSSKIAITLQIDQYVVTGGIDFQIQCRGGYPGALPVQIWPTCTTGTCNTVQNYAGTAGLASRTTVYTEVPFSACRVGMLIHTSDDGDDLTTNTEQIYIGLTRVNP